MKLFQKTLVLVCLLAAVASSHDLNAMKRKKKAANKSASKKKKTVDGNDNQAATAPNNNSDILDNQPNNNADSMENQNTDNGILSGDVTGDETLAVFNSFIETVVTGIENKETEESDSQTIGYEQENNNQTPTTTTQTPEHPENNQQRIQQHNVSDDQGMDVETKNDKTPQQPAHNEIIITPKKKTLQRPIIRQPEMKKPSTLSIASAAKFALGGLGATVYCATEKVLLTYFPSFIFECSKAVTSIELIGLLVVGGTVAHEAYCWYKNRSGESIETQIERLKTEITLLAEEFKVLCITRQRLLTSASECFEAMKNPQACSRKGLELQFKTQTECKREIEELNKQYLLKAFDLYTKNTVLLDLEDERDLDYLKIHIPGEQHVDRINLSKEVTEYSSMAKNAIVEDYQAKVTELINAENNYCNSLKTASDLTDNK